MKLFKAKPLTIEAVQYDGSNEKSIIEWSDGLLYPSDFYGVVPGSWVLKDGKPILFASDDWMQSHYEPLVS